MRPKLAILYRPDYLWSSNHFSVLHIYRTSDGATLRAIGSYANPVEDFAYAPDSRLILAGFVDGTLQLIDLETGAVEHASRHFGSPIRYMEHTGDGQFLVIQRANEVEIRRTADGALRARFDGVTFAQTADGFRLAIASPENEIRVIDLATWEDVHRFQAHDDVIFALAFSPDGRLLASSGQDCRTKIWDMATGEYVHDYEQVAVDAYGEGFTFSRIFVKQLQFVPGTDQLIGFGSWGTAVSWDVDSGAARYLVESAPYETYNGMVTLDPHFPEHFAADPADGRFFVDGLAYSLGDGSVLGPYVRPDGLPDGCLASGPATPDGSLRFTRGVDRYEGAICVLDNASLALLSTITVAPVPPGGRYSDLGWLYLSPDGSELVAYTYSGAIYVYAVGPD
jgi:WD40 repeat protein